MGDRDYKVVYRRRTLDRDEPRPEIPTALDPYNGSYAAEPRDRRRYSPRDSSSTIDDGSNRTETLRSSERITSSRREADRDRDPYVSSQRSSRSELLSPEGFSVRRSTVVDQRNDNVQPRRSGSVVDSRTGRDTRYLDVEVERPRGHSRDYYVDDRPRPAGAPYVIETRRGDVIDVVAAGRQSDRSADRGGGRYRYEDRNSTRYLRDRDAYNRAPDDVTYNTARSGNTVVVNRGRAPAYDQYQYSDQRSGRGPSQTYDDEREQDWRLVNSMKDTRINAGPSGEVYDEQTSRSRAQTYSSEDSYVMVSPSSVPRHRESSSSRSALRRSDYPEPELRQRRSRSISFRGSQVDYHDATERRHERPGAEAQIVGYHLRGNRPDVRYEGSDDTYAAYNDVDQTSRTDVSERDRATYRERDGPYDSQLDYNPRRRDRSRRRRREDDEDDKSYYSEKVVRKTTRETDYR